MRSPVVAVLKLPDDDALNDSFVGNSLVDRSTEPPLKLPGLSGVNVLDVTTSSSSPPGNRSSGTSRFSGSGLGSGAPFNCTFE